MDTLKELLALMLLFIIVAIAALFPAYIIMEISDLFRVPVFEDMMFYQVYGTIMVAKLILKNKIKKQGEKTLADVYGETFAQILMTYVSFLVMWGLSYIMIGILR